MSFPSIDREQLKAQLGRLPDWLSYFAAVLRTTEGTVMPTEGEILNYVKRQPLGVVVQVSGLLSFRLDASEPVSLTFFFHPSDRAFQPSSSHRRQEDCTSSRRRQLRHRQALRVRLFFFIVSSRRVESKS